MEAPQRVRFHITEAGPKRCVAQDVCPLKSDFPHYDSYSEAITAFEEKLAEEYPTFAPAKKTFDEEAFDALFKPTPAMYQVATKMIALRLFSDVGLGGSSITIPASQGHLRFVERVQEFVPDAPQEDLEAFAKLNSELKAIASLPLSQQFQERRRVQGALQPLMRKYRTVENRDAFVASVSSRISESPELSELVESEARRRAGQTAYQRALATGVTIPEDLGKFFEDTWNADRYTPGSKLYFEDVIVGTAKKKAALQAAPNPDIAANQDGYSSAKLAWDDYDAAAEVARGSYSSRGRNFDPTVKRASKILSSEPEIQASVPDRFDGDLV